ALILLGLEPGQPARAEKDESGKLRFFAPYGPELELFFVLEDQLDQPIPANQWVIDQENGQVMPGNRWVFTGSTIIEFKGQNHFMAEKNGTIVSLLNFGDELVSRPTTDSQDGGTEMWTANTEVIPPVGTKLTLRFRPAE
ncbi:MAG: YdjY domain-containing protein, partial [Planctomycetota bacterium]